jgi:uncharacterized protein YfiM (DUF2279 family)
VAKGQQVYDKSVQLQFTAVCLAMLKMTVGRLQLTVLFLICSIIAFAQDSVIIVPQHNRIYQTLIVSDSSTKNDTPLVKILVGSHYTYETDEERKQRLKPRVRLVAIGNIVGYGGTMVGLYSAWYKDYPQTNFHFFNDNKEWLQVDKVGHAYSAYVESRASMEMWRWAGLSRNKRIWIGGMSGAAYQTVIEVLDGFSAGWGWSWGDFAANTFGSGMLVAQELAWDEQRISFKFSTHKKNYPSAQLNERADQLFGKHFSQRFLKDYNAQTLWLSANLRSFFKKSNLPAWLNIAVGYGAEDMYGGLGNSWVDNNGNSINRNDLKRYRQFYLSPDIDLTKIRTRSKPLKVALFVLNSFKFPAPSLEFSQGKMKGHWVHF